MADCAELLVGLDPDCLAFKKIGGVKAHVYIGNRSSLNDSAPFTIDSTTKAITAFALKTGKKLLKFESRKEKHNGTYTFAPGDNVDSWTNAVNLVLYHYTQLDRNAIQGLQGQDDLFVVVPTAAGQYEVYGLSVNGTLEGLRMTAGGGGTGTVVNDSTAISVTLSGPSVELPILFDKGTGSTANATYLETLLVAAA